MGSYDDFINNLSPEMKKAYNEINRLSTCGVPTQAIKDAIHLSHGVGFFNDIRQVGVGQLWIGVGSPISNHQLVVMTVGDTEVRVRDITDPATPEYWIPRMRFENRKSYIIGPGDEAVPVVTKCGGEATMTFRTIDKKDENKPRWSLLPAGTIERIVAVLEFGAKKYQVDNWQGVPDARRRYYDAVMRHVEAWWGGEKNDPETGLPHLAHAATCLLFLMWFDNEKDVPDA